MERERVRIGERERELERERVGKLIPTENLTNVENERLQRGPISQMRHG